MIRPATAQDASAIAALWNWMIKDTLATFTTEEKSDEALLALVRRRVGRVFVEEESGLLRGFGTFGGFRPGPGYATTCEHSIIVSPEAQRQQIGHSLIQRLEIAARSQGYHNMIAAISSANPGAVAFHAAFGFEKVGHLPNVGRKKGHWLDLILMQKNLTIDG